VVFGVLFEYPHFQAKKRGRKVKRQNWKNVKKFLPRRRRGTKHDRGQKAEGIWPRKGSENTKEG